MLTHLVRRLALAAMIPSLPLAADAMAAGYDRPSGDPKLSRSAVIAEHGIVATSHPLASQAGLDVLKRGGNAADAAIAANAVLGVVEPMSCGLGGDLFVLYWEAKTGKLHGLNGSGRSPYSLSREVFQKKNLRQIPDTGVLSWSVPGCVAGWSDLNEKLGSRKLAELLAPAIEYADKGFPVSEIIGRDWAGSAGSLKQWPDSAETFLISGRAPAIGEIFSSFGVMLSGEGWQQALSLSEGLPDDLQGVFLVVAQAAISGEACPSDATLARAYGTHSARRARRLLAQR